MAALGIAYAGVVLAVVYAAALKRIRREERARCDTRYRDDVRALYLNRRRLLEASGDLIDAARLIEYDRAGRREDMELVARLRQLAREVRI